MSLEVFLFKGNINMKYMKLLVFSFSLGILPTCANATTKQISCDEVTFSFLTNNDYMTLSSDWKKNAVFPNSPQSGTLRFENYSLICPNISLKQTNDIIEIKANSYDELIKHMSSYFPRVDLFNYSGYQYPNIHEGRYNFGLTFDLDKNAIREYGSMDSLNGGEKLSSLSVPPSGVIGYKVNDGELKPLVFDGVVSDYKSDFANYDKLTIFIKSEVSTNSQPKQSFQALEIDKANGLLRIYKKHLFPNK